MHKCEKDPNFENDSNCLDTIKKHYVATDVLGHGVNGIVLKLISTDKEIPYAVKITQQTGDSLKEIKISCTVDELLASKHAVFSRTYGWLACSNNPPDDWMEMIHVYSRTVENIPRSTLSDRSFYLFTELGGISLKNYLYKSVFECKSILFELLYALIWASKTCGFKHGDLHKGNVILRFTVAPRNYTVNGKTYATNQQRPQIIDYADSEFHQPYNGGADFSRLMSSICRERGAGHIPSVVDFINSDELADLRKNTSLTHPVFDCLIAETKTTIPDFVVECHVCGYEAVNVYQHAPSFGFCKRGCVKRMGVIGNLIK